MEFFNGRLGSFGAVKLDSAVPLQAAAESQTGNVHTAVLGWLHVSTWGCVYHSVSLT